MPLLDNGSWVPIVLTDAQLMDPVAKANWHTVMQYMWTCDQMANVKDPFMYGLTLVQVPIYVVASSVAIAALPTTWRFARRPQGSGYQILFNIALFELYVQLRLFLWLFVEYFTGYVVRLPYGIDSMMASAGWTKDWLLTLLALNRSMARRTKYFILLAYLLIGTEVAIVNRFPWYWKFDCIYNGPKSIHPISDINDIILDNFTQTYNTYFYPIKGYAPICIYSLTVVKLTLDWVFVKLSNGINGNNNVNTTTTHFTNHAAAGHQQQQRPHQQLGNNNNINISINNNSKERVRRLFLICVLLALPNLGTVIMYLLVSGPFRSQMNETSMNHLVNLLYKPFDFGQYLAQPFVLLALSREFRRDVAKDLCRFLAQLPCVGTHQTHVQNTNNHNGFGQRVHPAAVGIGHIGILPISSSHLQQQQQLQQQQHSSRFTS